MIGSAGKVKLVFILVVSVCGLLGYFARAEEGDRVQWAKTVLGFEATDDPATVDIEDAFAPLDALYSPLSGTIPDKVKYRQIFEAQQVLLANAKTHRPKGAHARLKPDIMAENKNLEPRPQVVSIWEKPEDLQSLSALSNQLDGFWYVAPKQILNIPLSTALALFEKVFQPWRVNSRKGLVEALRELDIRRMPPEHDAVLSKRIMGFFRSTFFSPAVSEADLIEGAYFLFPLRAAQAEVMQVVLNRALELNGFLSLINQIKTAAPELFKEMLHYRPLQNYVLKKFLTYSISLREVLELHKITGIPSHALLAGLFAQASVKEEVSGLLNPVIEFDQWQAMGEGEQKEYLDFIHQLEPRFAAVLSKQSQKFVGLRFTSKDFEMLLKASENVPGLNAAIKGAHCKLGLLF